MGYKRKIDRHSYKNTDTGYNQTSSSNPSHYTEENTTFSLKPISLENIDQAVWGEFHRRIFTNNKYIDLIPLDAELAALRFENPIGQNSDNQFLNFPYFLYTRENTAPYESRISPSNKPVVFAIPKMKPQGIVYEEWICPPPQWLKLTYSFVFITSYREHLNSFETFMIDYFKNKRNVLDLDGERFEIFPDKDQLAQVEVTQREGSQGQTLYKAKYTLHVIAYLRDLSQIQKRERPNSYTFTLTEQSGKVLGDSVDRVTRKKNEEGLGFKNE